MTGNLAINAGNSVEANTKGHGLLFYHSSEGGNIRIYSGGGTSYMWEIDAAAGDLRMYSQDASGNNHMGVYIAKDTGVLMGAAWNDYAEFREADSIEPGRVVVEKGNDTLILSTQRL